jgi:hypothetical protein
MMKALAFAALAVTSPMVAKAQPTISLALTSQTINAGPGGGQFMASSSIGNLVVYCIDPFRQGSFTSQQYRVYTFAQYVAATLPSGFAFSQNTNDVNTMAANAMSIALNGVGASSNLAQLNTWDIFSGTANGSAQAGDFSNWRVLVSEAAISTTQGVGGYQTFITTVPEPSTYALFAFGLVGIGFAARRRRIS